MRSPRLRACLPAFALCLLGAVGASPEAHADTITITPNNVTLDENNPSQTFTAVYSIPNQESGEPEVLTVSVDGSSIAAQTSQSGLTVTATFTIKNTDFPCGVHTISATGRKDEDDPMPDSDYDYPETMTTTAQFTSKQKLTVDSATASPNPATTCDTVNFSAGATGCPPLTYAWDFGDGETGTGAQTTHKYKKTSPDDGFTVTVTVTDSLGNTATKSLNETVNECYTLSPAPVDENGNIGSGPAAFTTTSSPVVKSSFDIQLVPNGSYDTTDAQFTINGTINSVVCDVTPGQVIDHVNVYLDDQEQPFTTIPVTVNKTTSNQLNRYYSYDGTFATSAPIAVQNLIPGVHFLRFEAQEALLAGIGENAYMITIAPADPTGDPTQLIVSDVQEIQTADKDEATPTVVRVTGDKDMLSDPNFRVTVNGPDGGSEDRKVVRYGPDPLSQDPDGESYFIADASGTRPEVLLALPGKQDGSMDISPSASLSNKPGSHSFIAARDGLDLAASGLFLLGFGEGFFAGGVEMVKSTFNLLKIASDYTSPVFLINKGIQYAGRIRSGAYKKDIANVQATFEQFKSLGPVIFNMIMEYEKHQTRIYFDLISGNLKALKNETRLEQTILKLGADALWQAIDQWSALPPKEAGYKFGELIFNIASLFIPEGEVGAALEAGSTLTRAKFLEHVIPIMEKLGITSGRIRKLEEIVIVCKKGSICFTAGTPVATIRGMRAIETIQPGDLIYTRDIETGKQGYRPVMNVFVTRPFILYHVGYRVHHNLARSSTQSGDEDEEREIVCTGAHPIYAVNRGDFIPADGLAVGDTLSLASGDTATVTSLRIEEAADGQSFTTYNLDVDESHTYFAGPYGVWVHNANIVKCEDVLNLLKQETEALKKANSTIKDPWEILNYTLAKHFQRRPTASEAVWEGIFKQWAKDNGGIIKIKSYRYGTWKGQSLTNVNELKGLGCQGNHWWPKELNGADLDGSVFALSTPSLHTSGFEKEGYGFHYILTRFLRKEFTKNTEAEAVVLEHFRTGPAGLTDHQLFDWQQALLRKFYKEKYGLDMPTFVYDAAKTASGRGLYIP